MLQVLNDTKDDRTVGYVFKGNIQDLLLPFSIRMWIFTTGPRPCWIYSAVIIVSEEGTGLRYENIIPFVIKKHIFLYDLRGLLFKVPGERIDVAAAHGRTDRLAAICTLQAIYLLNMDIMQGIDSLISFSGSQSPEFGKELLIFSYLP